MREVAFVGEEALHLRALPLRILAHEHKKLAVRHGPFVEEEWHDSDLLRVLFPAEKRRVFSTGHQRYAGLRGADFAQRRKDAKDRTGSVTGSLQCCLCAFAPLREFWNHRYCPELSAWTFFTSSTVTTSPLLPHELRTNVSTLAICSSLSIEGGITPL